ncbi:uncharacterized protein LOC124387237 [Silurus meridionalis]|uniref:uncharacterized protein LOC124387237 n=1 Tax=Silurus meridionalis TaxID=175797 RepID=UPI001EE9D694|nr:uncharacterized protein LOC124387237 [Silurus meridionalis]XP_046707420.1 uncharacterized protein LOC124387237 [Silurus meridionalis]
MMWSYLHITFIILSFLAGSARVHVVYKLIGDKAHLTLKERWNITVKWRKDYNLIAVVENRKPSIKQPGKFHLRVSDNSLFIHNLTVSDSGDYQAQIGQWEEEKIRYKLIVQEAVSKPVINTSLDRQSNTSSVCHIWVKCSADEDSVTYNCDHQHCIRTNATFTRVNITVNYRDTGVLECTASNHVSMKWTSIPMSNTCSQKEPGLAITIDYIMLLIIMFCTMVLVVLVICTIKHFCRKRKKKQTEGKYQENKGVNSVYAEVGKPLRAETLANRSTAQNATTIYTFPLNCKM